MSDIVERLSKTKTIDSLEENYRAESPKSRAYFERCSITMPGGAKGAYFYTPYPLTMEKGEGCYLFDLDGRRFIDFVGHHTTQILGHNHPSIIQAIEKQIKLGIALGAHAGVEAEIAETMCRRVKSLERIRFCNSGTEATLHAIRLARGFSGRSKIAKFEGGYHGSHDAVEVSVAPPLDKAGPAAAPASVSGAGGASPHAAKEVVILPYNDEVSVKRLLNDNCNELACVIFDPKAGIMTLNRNFVQFVREITKELGILLIFDEIVGFRLSSGGLQEIYSLLPDLTTFGKLVGGGLPVGAFGGRADIMSLLDNTLGATGFFQSGTFSAHPLAMAAGLATLEQLTPEAFDRLNGLGVRLYTGLRNLFYERGIDAQVVGLGTVFSIYFSNKEAVNYRNIATADTKIAHSIFHALLQKGYFLSHNLTMNSLSLALNESHIDGLIEAMRQAVNEVF